MKKLLERIYQAERRFVALATGVMGTLVFLDVVHRVVTRERSLAQTAVIAVLGFGVMALALRTRDRAAPLGRVLATSAAVVVACGALLRGFVWLMPNGLVWSQTLGLVLMLWIAMVGASMAAHEHRHLALDLGSKLWPKALLPRVQAVGNLVTALFCLALAGLSIVSLRSHYGDWALTPGAGEFAALALPKWIAFVALPSGFGVMAVRFFVQALASYAGEVEEDDAMHMLGLDQDAEGHTPAQAHGAEAKS